MNFKPFYSILFFINIGFSYAQVKELPENAEIGKCYKKCLQETKYETITQEVMVKDAYKKIIPQPAEYDTVYKEVLEQEAYVVFEVVPAEFTTAEVEVVVEPAYSEFSHIPPVFETQEEYVILEPAQYKWVRKIKDVSCFDERDLDDCVVWCWEIIPPRLDTLYQEVVKVHAKPLEKMIPPVVKKINKTLILKPASLKRTIIPAKYRTVPVVELVKPATVIEEEVPAEYMTIAVRKVVKDEVLDRWTEIDCNRVSYIEEP